MNDCVQELLDGFIDAYPAVIRPNPEVYWRASKELLDDSSARRFSGLENLHGGEITLGFYKRSHIGDVLCTSTLPRKLSDRYGCKVYAVRHRSTLNLLANNPYVAGFRNIGRVHLSDCLSGIGHLIQKLERFFDLPIDPYPRPEVHLSDDESQWAWSIRRLLPHNKPVVLACTHSVTDVKFDRARATPWQQWIKLLTERATVVQLALTDVTVYEQTVALSERHRSSLRLDSILDDCFVLENLAAREFVAVFSIADMYFGTNAGGCHLAAAFDVPALVVLNAVTRPGKLIFPNPREGEHNAESFLYPNHFYVFS